MKKGRTTANLEEGELEEDETISIGMVHVDSTDVGQGGLSTAIS